MIIGGGVAGLSAGAMLSQHARVVVVEAEDSTGYHSSGRSATMLHYALGNALVRSLTLASRPFFEQPPDGFSNVPLGRTTPVLVHAREDELAGLEALEAAIAPFAALDRIDASAIARLCPVLKVGDGGAVAALADRTALKIDSDALLQGYARMLRQNGGTVLTGARVAKIARSGSHWTTVSEGGERISAPVLVNGAGSWADEVAELAGVEPIGLAPMRRTIITFDGPDGMDVSRLPFTKTVGDELYFGAESGRVFASPMDEVPTEPCDAQPDDYEVAVAAYRVEERTTMQVKRIAHKWAGLRTFTSDRNPAVGFARDAEGFFWLAGQGGFGLQTSPAVGQIAASLVCGTKWPLADVSAEDLSPNRFLRQSA